jgi:HK97 gp10 family phage protein
MALPLAAIAGRLTTFGMMRGFGRGGRGGGSGPTVGITVDVVGSEQVARTLSQLGPRQAKNLLRSSTRALASTVMKDAKSHMVWSEGYSTGATKRGTRLRQRRIRDGQVQFDIVVHDAFWWRFHEYGQGVPEKAMFGRAVHAIRSKVGPMFEQLFVKKLAAMLAREAKKQGGR